MKNSILTAVIFVCFFVGGLNLVDYVIQEQKDINSGIYLVKVKGGGSGTGFLIGPRKLVTAKHVCEGHNGFVTVSNDKEWTDAAEITIHPSMHLDVCVIKLTDKLYGRIYKLSPFKVKEGFVYSARGFANGKLPLSEKQIQVTETEIISRSFYIMDSAFHAEYLIRGKGKSAVIPGMSGGPFIAESGVVFGVNARFSQSGHSFFVPSYRFKEWAEDL